MASDSETPAPNSWFQWTARPSCDKRFELFRNEITPRVRRLRFKPVANKRDNNELSSSSPPSHCKPPLWSPGLCLEDLKHRRTLNRYQTLDAYDLLFKRCRINVSIVYAWALRALWVADFGKTAKVAILSAGKFWVVCFFATVFGAPAC